MIEEEEVGVCMVKMVVPAAQVQNQSSPLMRFFLRLRFNWQNFAYTLQVFFYDWFFPAPPAPGTGPAPGPPPHHQAPKNDIIESLANSSSAPSRRPIINKAAAAAATFSSPSKRVSSSGKGAKISSGNTANQGSSGATVYG
ncbi:hypothetical protein Tco_1238048 [Tanacetum coccineum]